MDRASAIQLFKEVQLRAKREARKSMQGFVQYTKEDYTMKWFHHVICDYLDRLLDDENYPDVQKLMIFVPPQHGKSELSSRRFPAYILGKNPAQKVALCCYSPDLAGGFNRNIQQIIDDESYIDVFPETYLNSSRVSADSSGGVLRNTHIFETVNHHGYVKTVGIGQALTGTTVDIGIIDDPFKDRTTANSQKQRDHVWDWYQDVFSTRLHNKSKQLMLFTRWHEDDLAGRILDPENPCYDEEEAKQWSVITIPALREEDDEKNEMYDDPRAFDEALWEDKHNWEKFDKQRRINPIGFNSLSQQRPTAPGGNMIKTEQLQVIKKSELPFNPERVTWDFWIDGAYTNKNHNDPSALLSAYHHKATGDTYIAGCEAIRKEMPELIDYFRGFFETYYGNSRSKVNIEGKASGKSLKQLLRMPKFGGYNTVEINNEFVKDGKITRVENSGPFLASGKIHIIEGPWNKAFISECTAFPNGKHDDMVDVLTYAIHEFYIKKRRGRTIVG